MRRDVALPGRLAGARACAAALLALALLAPPPRAAAQHEAPPAAEAPHHGLRGTHRLTLGLGHTHVINSVLGEDGELTTAALPSWVFNYDYWLSDRWALGVQSDVIVESFVIEHGDQQLLERSYPVLLAATVLFKPFRHITFVGGAGLEYATSETLAATRLGVEAGTHVGSRWEVGASATWDLKWDYYDAWSLNFTVSRLLGGKR